MASLLVLEGPHAGSQLELGPETVIGRSPTCDLVLDDVNVSRRHAQILIDGQGVRLVDLGSRNGTQLNGERVQGSVALKPGDRVRVGPMVVAFDPDPLRVFGPAGGTAAGAEGPVRSLPAPEGPEGRSAPVHPVMRRIFDEVTRAATPAGALRVAMEQALQFFKAEQALLLSFSAENGIERSEVVSLVGSLLFTVPPEFEPVLRRGGGAVGEQHLGVAVSLPAGPGAIVLQRKGLPFTDEDGRVLTEVALLSSRIALGAHARQEPRAAAFPLALWRERPALLSPHFKHCLERIALAAKHHGPLLLVGEPATGRDELALTVHQMGKRAEGPFVTWRAPSGDMGAEKLPPVESITGALRRSEGGTLYLGDISGWSQQLGELWAHELDRFTPSLLTSDARIPSPIRLVAASGVSPAKLSTAGKLPATLLLRFEGERVDVPSLRKRKADLPLLVERLSAAAGQRLGRSVPKFSAAAMKALTDYAWPGNLAELQVCLEWTLFACGPETELQLWDLPPQVRAGDALTKERNQPLAQMIATLERTAIVEALRESGFKKIHAAASLGISRPTLDKKIAEYQIRLKA